MWFSNAQVMVGESEALAGRSTPVEVSSTHVVLGTALTGPFDPGLEIAYLALGCFWGAERCFYRMNGVYSTAVGYQGGFTPNPTYEEVCSGKTGHTESVMVVFDPAVVTYAEILSMFFESHDPTQGFRQGNDLGTQYRSALFTTSEAQQHSAEEAASAFGDQLEQHGFGQITTEITPAGLFYYAEDYHQQYLAKNPNGYCGLGGTGVSCPVGLFRGS